MIKTTEKTQYKIKTTEKTQYKIKTTQKHTVHD